MTAPSLCRQARLLRPSALAPQTTFSRASPVFRVNVNANATRAYALGSDDFGQDKKHVTDKPDANDVQSSASKASQKEKASAQNGDGDGAQSQATAQRDFGNHNARAKEEHPKAPGPVIGMNDERGGKGH